MQGTGRYSREHCRVEILQEKYIQVTNVDKYHFHCYKNLCFILHHESFRVGVDAVNISIINYVAHLCSEDIILSASYKVQVHV